MAFNRPANQQPSYAEKLRLDEIERQVIAEVRRRTAALKSGRSPERPINDPLYPLSQRIESAWNETRDHLFPLRPCTSCLTVLNSYDFPPTAISVKCKHKSEVQTCLGCLSQSLAIQVRENGPDDISCPECKAGLSASEIQKLTTPEVYKMYQIKVRISKDSNRYNFAWCAAPNCISGQIHVGYGGGTHNRMTCIECKAKTCVLHKVPWHEKETCAQYDSHQSSEEARMVRAKEEMATESMLKNSKTTKTCPNCGALTNKADGCHKVTCRCKFQFCWGCLMPLSEIAKKGHAKGCTYSQYLYFA